MTEITVDEKRICKRLWDDFQHYAAKCLKIRAKSAAAGGAGAIEPLRQAA